MPLKQEIDEIYLTLFLLRCGMEFEDGRDAERIAEMILFSGILTNGRPPTEGIALKVGVGEDDDLVGSERLKHRCGKHLETSARHPYTVGEMLTADDGGLLGFHDTDYRFTVHASSIRPLTSSIRH